MAIRSRQAGTGHAVGRFTEAQLRRIIRALAEDEPALVAAIEQQVEWLRTAPVADTAPTAPGAHAIPFDLVVIRREIRKDFCQAASTGGGSGYSDRSWDYDEAGMIYADEVLGPHRELAERLLAAGDAAVATGVITAMIEELGEGIAGLDEWIAEVDEDAFQRRPRSTWGCCWPRRCRARTSPLTSGPMARPRRGLGRRPDHPGYGRAAMNDWWDYPPLVTAMQGNITEQGAWEGEAPDFADELTLVGCASWRARVGRKNTFIWPKRKDRPVSTSTCWPAAAR